MQNFANFLTRKILFVGQHGNQLRFIENDAILTKTAIIPINSVRNKSYFSTDLVQKLYYFKKNFGTKI